MLTGENGIINNASTAKIQTELSSYKERVDLYKTQKVMENINFNEQSLTAGKDSISYNTKPEEETGNIKTIIPEIKDEYISSLQIIKGSLLINTKDKKMIKIAQTVGIDVNPYDITDEGELLSSNGNLLLMGEDGTLVLPDSVKKIGYGAFSGVSGLKKIIMPVSVTEIEPYAFSNNSTLEKVEIKGDLLKIGGYAFDGDANLKEINLPNTINYIGMRAFRGTGLTELVIPKSLESIGLETFCYCKLTKLVFQEGLKSIEEGAFCDSLFDEIKIPSTLSYISGRAFENCNNLNNIDVSNNTNFSYTSGILMNIKDNSISFISSAKLSSITEFEIPDGIKNFGNNISKFSNINKIIIPSSLENTNAMYFPVTVQEVEIKEGNNKLIVKNNILYNVDNEMIMCFSKEKEINIFEGIETAKSFCFQQAANAENITLPDSLINIEQRIVTGNAKIKNINVGKNVANIAPLFNNNNYAIKFNIDENNSKYEIKDNILYEKVNGRKEKLVKVLYLIEKTMPIEQEVKTLGSYSFYGQSKLTEISIPNGVTNIERAFNNCPSLYKVEIPNTVTSIDDQCFSDGTKNLSQIIIKNKENAISGAPWGATKGMKIVTWENE